MPDCRQIESLLAPFVDGDADRDRARVVEAHVAECAVCRREVEAQRTARAVLRARATTLATVAPPGLRARIAATLDADQARVNRRIGWTGRITAFAAAAVVLLGTASALELVTPQSNVLYAAQLAIDHMRCFVVELTSTEGADARQVAQRLAHDYGWSIGVPPSNAAAGLTLVAARRCPFWIGNHAHLLYRSGDREVSLYVTPDTPPRTADLHVLGHSEKLWSAGGKVYTLVTKGLDDAQLARVSAYLERETRVQ